MTVSKKMDLLGRLSRDILTGLNIELRRHIVLYSDIGKLHRISCLEVTVRRINRIDVAAKVNTTIGCTHTEISSKEMDVKLLSELGTAASTDGTVPYCRILFFFNQVNMLENIWGKTNTIN